MNIGNCEECIYFSQECKIHKELEETNETCKLWLSKELKQEIINNKEQFTKYTEWLYETAIK